MSRTARIIVGLIVLALIVIFAILAFIWFSGGSGAPSAPLSAPTLNLSTRLPTATAPIPPTAPATAEVTAQASAEASSEASAAVTAEASAETTAQAAQGQLVVFNIDATQSQVSFTLHEVLRGSPNTVQGTTNQVAGQIGVDFSNPTNSQVGEIRIDARSFATDSELRNRAIRGEILQSQQDQFEFISFKPTSISGLPSTVTIGKPIQFQITGDLTIRNITNSVTFDVTVTPDSQTKIEGKATATVTRAEYQLQIPNVPGVADVEDQVVLELDFIALTGS